MNGERSQALMNVAVFTPLAVYAWRGERPPELLLLASLLYTGFMFLRDFNTLLTRQEAVAEEAAQLAGQSPALPSFAEIQRFRVNR